MTMKLQFDPWKEYQLDAVAAVSDLFEGQPEGPPEYSVIDLGAIGGIFAGQSQTELGVGNRLLLPDENLFANLREVEIRNDIEPPDADLEGWRIFDAPLDAERLCPHFSVEMETGTGKTYVYLRTLFELSQKYGFQKFIIVVPSVAIREGVLKNIEITSEHFKTLFNNLAFEYFVYDSRRVNRLRQFAVSNTLQIMVMNIDAFRKSDVNVIYKESDKLSGRQPIEFVQAARPIVIIDEPQSVDATEDAQEAIKKLNPLCTLRYSATHKNPYNLVYRLDPVRAFELKLVKQVVVSSATGSGTANDAWVRVEKIDHKAGIKAKVRINVQAPGGPKPKSVTVKSGSDLHALSEERAEYQDGFSVAEISAEEGNKYIRFNNGTTLREGQELGGLQEDIWRLQIKHTVKKHLDKELEVGPRGMKVLSLFFIDRVANYRAYDSDGKPTKGKFAEAFEQALTELAKDPRYAPLTWLKEPTERLHDGYFAQDPKGLVKDTGGNTQADESAYNLIMKDKERLLDLQEPLRFIFSHSALREGWDNPNVFQICTLNESRSAMKKRQEIGRGLRLPVDQNGNQVVDESTNRLFIMANESYEDFARALQTEYEEDCGVTFGKVPLLAIAKLTRVVDGVEVQIGSEDGNSIRDALIAQGMIDATGKLQDAFDPVKKDFALELPTQVADLAPAVVDLLSSYMIERHIRRERDEGPNRLKKQVQLSPEFEALWHRIKPRTTYRVEFETPMLISRSVDAIKKMGKIEPPKVKMLAGKLTVEAGGVKGIGITASEESIAYGGALIPDILAYLQNQTELTRSTLTGILIESDRLAEFFVNPQRFMDSVAAILKNELHKLLIDGIKYEQLGGSGPEAEWEMLLFKDGELINYLTAQKVENSIYEYVICDSEIERSFARRLDEREDIKLFVKLPSWFKIDTPIGTYNPDWAIMKEESEMLYLVRETKGTRDFLKLRNAEADKVRCGLKHFETLGVPFAVAVTADEV